MNYFQPLNHYFNLDLLELEPQGDLVIRKLSDMADMYQDQKAVKKALPEDPIIYKFYNVNIPEQEGHLQHCVSILYPGKIGNEYYMTKGHFHVIEDTAEIYLTFCGKGRLLMQTLDNEIKVLDMKPGSISYIPPCWGHRTVNTGQEPLVFFGVYRGDAGHNYGIIEKKGMVKLILEKDGKVSEERNSNYLQRG